MMDPSTLTAENLERVIAEFYRSHDKNQLALSHDFIIQAQSSPAAWTFVWELLDANKPVEVQFFAASTLQMKLLKSWVEVPQDQWNALKERLLSAIFFASFGPKNVLNRLCIAMAVFITRIIGEGSTTAVSELTQQLLSVHNNVPPDQAKLVLLQILTMLAEESGSVAALPNQRVLVKQEIRRCAPEVLTLVEQEIPHEGKKSDINSAMVHQALLCYLAWQTEADVLFNWESFTPRLIHIVQIFAEPHEDTVILTVALDCLRILAIGPNTQKMPCTILQIINRYLVLMDIVDREMASQSPDLTLVATILRFLVEVGESHTRVLLDALTQPDYAQTAICVIQRVLQCTGSPGQYPTEEQNSEYTFSFWYLLQDDMQSLERAKDINPIVAPFYLSLVDILVYKSMYPEKRYMDENWNSDTHTMFICYRQDIIDTLIYCHSVLQDCLLERISQHLETAVTALNSEPTQWRVVEAAIHSFFAVAGVIPFNENKHVPRFLSCLKHLPFTSLDVTVAKTALQVIGSFAEWLNDHPEGIPHVIPLVVMGLHCEEAAPCATMTLKDLTRACQASTLNQHASTILDAAKDALVSRRLKSNENIRLMFSVGKVLSIYPNSDIIAYLNEVLLPYVTELKGLSELEPSPENSANILDRLKMVSSLFSTLYASKESETNRQQGSGDQNEGQPIVTILVTMLPMLKNIATAWASHETISEALSSIIKHAFSTLADECAPILPDLIDVLLSSYRVCLQPSVIDVSRQLIIMFGRDTQRVQFIRSFLGELVCRTMSATDVLEKAEENPDILKSTFSMLAQIVKKNSTLLLTSDGIDMASVFQWGSMCMLIREALTARAATSFMTQLILTSRELPGVPTVINQYGCDLVRMLLIHIGEVPSNRVEPISDLLLALNKKYCEQLSQWLSQLLSQEGYPTVRPSKQEKEQFARSILRERVSKRKVERYLYDFALICRGINTQANAAGPVVGTAL